MSINKLYKPYRYMTSLNVLLISIIFLLSSCTGNSGNGKKAEVNKQEKFPYVSVPSFITTQHEAVKYLAGHFWNDYFKAAEKDTALYTINQEIFEEAYAQYVSILNMIEKTTDAGNRASGRNSIGKSQKQLFAIADSLYMQGHKAPLMRLMDLGEKYLYDPNSPFLNEETYIPALEAILELKSIDSLNKISYKYQLDMAVLNRVGTKANDFEYVYANGNTNALKPGSLYKIKADYLLIYFNNPDCNSCKEQQQQLVSDPRMQQLSRNGNLKVLAMYIDEQTDLWENNYKNIPQDWIYARDPNLVLRDNELYGIRAIPSMYLLDNNKNVLLKDALAAQVIEYLNSVQ